MNTTPDIVVMSDESVVYFYSPQQLEDLWWKQYHKDMDALMRSNVRYTRPEPSGHKTRALVVTRRAVL
jgi:hypothetical protein